MGEITHIQWTDHTFNPWIGCTKVDELCAHCYAENATPTRVARKKGVELWGKGKARQRTSENNWKEPLRWNFEARPGFHVWKKIKDFTGIGEGWTHQCAKCGSVTDSDAKGHRGHEDGCTAVYTPKVFCASLADWLDEEVPIAWLADLLKLIHDTPNLTWQLLTKRPENWSDRLHEVLQKNVDDDCNHSFEAWLSGWLDGDAPPNVWIGTSVGTQKSADTRIPQLLAIPVKVRFLSCEPLLEAVDLTTVRHGSDPDLPALDFGVIHWVICGGESGPKARPMHPCWALALRDQCQAAKVPFFFKQWGEYAVRSGLNCGTDFGAIDPECTKWPQVIRLGEHGKNTRRLENAEGAGEEIYMQRVGKKLAGRLLDGREWNEFPEV